jgi:DNA processing protein
VEENILAHLSFSYFSGIGPNIFSKLVKRFKSAQKAYGATRNELTAALGQALVDRFVDFRNEFSPVEAKKQLNKQGIGYKAQIEVDYPPLLNKISDPPIGLFYKGNWQNINWKNDKFFTIVGTRKPSHYGKNQAINTAKALAGLGVVLVSGLAIGIDACVHNAVLSLKNGRAIAVLGGGLNNGYPQSNRFLYQKIINNGLVVSEFPPQSFVVKGMFVSRNRIVAGLSRGTLVIEGTKKSGTLITAKYAANQGREVFALPGEIDNYLSEAPLLLIKQGAEVYTKVEDIENFLAVKRTVNTTQNKTTLTKSQLLIVKKLQVNELTTNELLKDQANSFQNLIVDLSLLELLGIIEQSKLGKWIVK